ncbi:MAG: hypothetical protein R2874_07610 [Desulfobacterales bacterium]
MIWNFTGGFSPLKGFMVRSDYESVLDRIGCRTMSSGRCPSAWMYPNMWPKILKLANPWPCGTRKGFCWG